MWNVALFAVGAASLAWTAAGDAASSLFVPSVCTTVLCMNAVALIVLPAGRTLELDVDSSLLAANLMTAQLMATRAPERRWPTLLSLLFFPLGPMSRWADGVRARCSSATCSVLGAKARWDFSRLILFLQACMLLTFALSFGSASLLPARGVATFYTPVFGFPHRFGALHQLTTALHGVTGVLATVGGAVSVGLFARAAWRRRLQAFPLAYAELYSVLWLVHGFFGTIMGARRMLDEGLLRRPSAARPREGFPSYILMMFGMILIMVGGHGVRILLGLGPHASAWHRRLQVASLGVSGVSVASLVAVALLGVSHPPGTPWNVEYGAEPVPATYVGISAFWLFELVNVRLLARRDPPPRAAVATAWMSLSVMSVTAMSTAINLTKTKHFPDRHGWLLVGPWVVGWVYVAAVGGVAATRA